MVDVSPDPENDSPTVSTDVELGFVEESDRGLLTSPLFPSKVGGRPSWLSLSPLPAPDALSCRACRGPCVFLLQVYAPRAGAFHRTIFVFVCRNPDCNQFGSRKNFRVLRSQLPRCNPFYSAEPPPPEDQTGGNAAALYQSLCRVCGAAAPKTCARCRKVSYCSREHQAADWKTAHKAECSRGDFDLVDTECPDVLFREFELVTEPEDYKEDSEKSNEEKMKEYFETKEKQNEVADSLVKNLERMAYQETLDDQQFLQFRERIKGDPEQVLRYNRGGEPLWISSENKPTGQDIPQCPCGKARQFEFQIMPQLLNHLNIDQMKNSTDWGTLAVYTCSDSCGIGCNYQEEFLWKQDYPMNK